jgi:hypothetical protein
MGFPVAAAGVGPRQEYEMKQVRKILAGVAIGAGMLAASMVSASAEIVCQGRVCWHVHDHFDYPASAGVVVHEDNWHWGPREKFSFREHEGHGYWHGGHWTTW